MKDTAIHSGGQGAAKPYPAPACSVPGWIMAEVKATWTAMQGVGQMEAYRIMDRMVRRLGYGDLRDPSLAPNAGVDRPTIAGMEDGH